MVVVKMKGVSVFYIALLLQLTDIISAGFLECWSDSECLASTATCKNNICECPQGQVFNSEGTACLPIVIGMQAVCEDDQQCAWLLGKHTCNKGKCDCQEGWRYYEGRCVKFSRLGETCNVDQDCFNNYDILAMVCNNGICECNKGYYLRGDYDCRPESTVLGDYCSLDSDCKIEGSACIASFCVDVTNPTHIQNLYQEDDLSTIEGATGGAIGGYEDDCESNTDCSSLKDTICYSPTKKCVCKRGYFLTKDGCVAELGVDIGCKEDTDCKITPGQCIDGKCYCRKTYFTAKTNGACQKPMTHDNLFCNNIERCYVLGMEVTCATNACRCKVTAELDDNFVCKTIEGPGSGGCDADEDCAHITNSICSDSRCACPNNYRLEKNTCLPNIGAACDDNQKPCEIDNTICGTDNNCTCIENYVPNGVMSCLKKSTGLDDDCEIDLQCSETQKNSECVEKTCKCFENYLPINGSCHSQKFMGDVCTSIAECHIMLRSNVQCRNSICQCSPDMQVTKDGRDCESSASSLFLHSSTIVLSTICYLTLKFPL